MDSRWQLAGAGDTREWRDGGKGNRAPGHGQQSGDCRGQGDIGGLNGRCTPVWSGSLMLDVQLSAAPLLVCTPPRRASWFKRPYVPGLWTGQSPSGGAAGLEDRCADRWFVENPDILSNSCRKACECSLAHIFAKKQVMFVSLYGCDFL